MQKIDPVGAQFNSSLNGTLRMITVRAFCSAGLSVGLLSCATQPVVNDPDWTRGATRTFDNGYIVYIGKNEAPTAELAGFRAEGIALEDLANECSVVPKGARLEDRYQKRDGKGAEQSQSFTAFVKIAVEFKDCQEAAKATEPSEIKKIASVPFTQQLKRYQDLIETGTLASTAADDAGSEVTPPTEYAPLPERHDTNETTHFYVTRQYIAYQKEIVVLSPPSAYRPASTESQKFIAALTPAQTQMSDLMQKNATLQTQPQAWSKVEGRPAMPRPPSLTASSVVHQATELKGPRPVERRASTMNMAKKRLAKPVPAGRPGSRKRRRHQ
jgi:hypothetical protein